MKVSFLVTYYNQREYVKRSMDSILQVKVPCEWEILVGDDGSDDGTTDIVRQYIEKYPESIKLFIMERDSSKKYDSVKRASANRLNLLSHMNGDYFCIIDGDDYYCDYLFIEQSIKLFEKIEGLSVVLFGYNDVVDGVVCKSHLIDKKRVVIVPQKKYLLNYYIHSGACVYKNFDDSKRLKFIKKYQYYDDNDIVINSMNYGNMIAFPKTIYSYVQSGNGIYTSMKNIEKAVLNMKGYEVDKRLIDPCYNRLLLHRYRVAFFELYYSRYNIDKTLGVEKCKKILNDCTKDEIVLTSLLEYKKTEFNKRFLLFVIYLDLLFFHPITAFLVKIKKW